MAKKSKFNKSLINQPLLKDTLPQNKDTRTEYALEFMDGNIKKAEDKIIERKMNGKNKNRGKAPRLGKD